MWPPAHFNQPLGTVLRKYLVSTVNGRAAIAVSVLGIAIAASWEPLTAAIGLRIDPNLRAPFILAPLFMFMLFVMWPPKQAFGSIMRWLLFAVFLLAPFFQYMAFGVE